MDLRFWRKNRYNQRDLEPQEILLDVLSQRQEDEMGRYEIPLSDFALRASFVIFCLIFAGLLFRVGQMQIIEKDKFNKLSDNNQYTYKASKALRGVVYDRNGEQLVFNMPRFDFVCEKSQWKEEYGPRIALYLQKDPKDFIDAIKEKDNSVIVAKNMDQGAVVLVHSHLQEFPGCSVTNDTIRNYYAGENFSHLIGYKKTDGKGDGVEMQFDQYLSPKEAKVKVERNAKGQVVSQNVEQFPEPGQSLVLNVDAGLQKKIVEVMEAALKTSGAVTAAIVAMNPQNGEVLALVSLPGYNNNIFSQGVSQDEWQKLQSNKYSPFLNRAIAGQYPSGSTIKPFVAAGALDKGVIKETTIIYSPERFCISNRYSGTENCYVDWKFHGDADVKRAIAESVNPFFYSIGGGYGEIKGLGAQALTDYLKIFGFGSKTNVDLPGEQVGNVPTPQWKEEKLKSRWSLGDTYNLSIGQGYLQITPLQLAVGISSIANGGKMYKPLVVQKIIDDDKKTLQEFKPEILKQNFINPDVLRIVRAGMRQTVASQSGNAHLLVNLPTSSAAKTGTAQISRKGYYDTWIEIFAPYETPEITLVIVAEEIPTSRFFVLQASYEILKYYFEAKIPKPKHQTATTTPAPLPPVQEINDIEPLNAQSAGQPINALQGLPNASKPAPTSNQTSQ